MATKKDMTGKTGRNWSQSVDLHDSKTWGMTPYKPEPDDRPSRKTPRDRNTGSKLANKLKGKVIG